MQTLCASHRAVNELPPALLPLLAYSLLPPSALIHPPVGFVSLPAPAGPTASLAPSVAAAASPFPPSPFPHSPSWDNGLAGQRQAAVLAGMPLGLRALGRAGVLEARAAAFVTAAQEGGESAEALHRALMPGEVSHLWETLTALTSLIAWPHAPNGCSDEPGVRQGFSRPLARLAMLPWVDDGAEVGVAPVPAPPVPSAVPSASPSASPLHYEESHAAGLLLLSVLAADACTAFTLRRRCGLVSHLIRAAERAEAEGEGEEAEGGGRKRAGSSSSSSSSAKRRRGRGLEVPAPIVGIPVPIAAWKVEHIDAFIEAALKKE